MHGTIYRSPYAAACHRHCAGLECSGATSGRNYTGVLSIGAVAVVALALWCAIRQGAPLHKFYTRQRDALFAAKNYLITLYVTAQIMVSNGVHSPSSSQRLPTDRSPF